MTQSNTHHTATHLKTQLGWTEDLIKQRLGAADRQAPNPHNQNSPPMRLFLAERVQRARDADPNLRRQLDYNIAHYEARNRDRRQDQLMTDEQLIAVAEAMEVRITDLPSNDVGNIIQLALADRDDYAASAYGLDDFRRLDPDSVEARRQAVHYVRHRHTNYEELLLRIPQVGRPEIDRRVYETVKRRVMESIAAALPELAETCQAMIHETTPQPYPTAPSAEPPQAAPDRLVALDIETVKPFPDGADWRRHRPLGIACVALASPEGASAWYGRDGDGAPAERMARHEVSELVDHLLEITGQGHVIITWNGMGFDWQVLAEESGRLTDCRELAQGHVDMMYHFFCSKGFPLGLAAAAAGMSVGAKTAGISGRNAPELWAGGQRQAVIDYCSQDAALTLDLATAGIINRRLSWTARSGRPNHLLLPNGWLTVRQAGQIPLPDTSWMKSPLERSVFDGWLTNAA